MKLDAKAWEPMFVHNCRDCRFLSRVRDYDRPATMTLKDYDYDLYICDQHNGEKTTTVVARFEEIGRAHV